MDKRINFKDVTFIIPIRVDSEDRTTNLRLIIEYINEYFITKILVLEADVKERFFNTSIKKIFKYDSNPIYHRTKYLNEMINQTNSPYIAVWDTDVLIESIQIQRAIEILRKKQATMVLPYDGRFFNVPKILKTLYIKTMDLSILKENIEIMHLAYGRFSVGGAFLVDRKDYLAAGKENENIIGWGPEDFERVKRFEILGYKVINIEGPLYHLHHPRGKNSWFASKDLELNNKKEYLTICKQNKNQLAKSIQKWHWVKAPQKN